MKTGIFYAVGVGTEPLDLTLRAKQVLETAQANRPQRHALQNKWFHFPEKKSFRCCFPCKSI